jgi:outer membrane protein
MMRNGVAWLCGCLAGMLAMTVEAGGTNTLTLHDAQEIAVKNHPRITSADLVALASKEVVRQVRSAYFPIVTANLTAVGTSGDNTRIGAGGLNNPLIFERAAAGVNVNQMITDFGRTANLTAASKLHSQARAEDALATRAQILLEVNSAYFGALEAQSVLQVANQTEATRQLIYEQVSQLATNQLRSGLDVSFAEVDLQAGRLLVANAHNDVDAAFARLENLLGEREQREWLLVDESAAAGPTNDVAQLVQMGLHERPDLVELRFEGDAAARYARAEHDLNLPTISAVGAAGVIPVHDPAMKDNYAAAGVNLGVPIFEGMLFSARQKEADLRAKSMEENLRDAENNVIRDVRVAVMNLNYASERLTLTKRFLQSAGDAFDLAQARYKLGSSSIVELSQAQLSKTEAEIALARAKYEYQIRASMLRYQTGQLR